MSADLNGVAIVGMAGRFPKARNVREFWANLCGGVEGISFFSEDELAREGIDFSRGDTRYVKARGMLQDADLFDAAFFGMNPREAEIMDPQHRIFLECAWEALESAGYCPEKFKGAIGVFAGMSMNTYLPNNLRGNEELMAQVGDYQAMLGNDKDFLPTRVSYKLNLKGPSLNIQTACSTSLVAVCVACQNLLNYECDMALAGAVSVTFPQKKGYLYQQGGIVSPDGHCRAFDAKAEGTVAGEGVGIVVLKRLEQAVQDRDFIYAAIKGFAINNDGSLKVGYTAPSVEGQAEAIETAQGMAGFSPESISYVEAHGTGTPLGDPIEVEGLTRAFRCGTEAKEFCAIGSVKSNIGHLDTAAGVAGLIKVAQALHYKKLPATLHFTSPNPKIDFKNSPFYVNDKLREWESSQTPRRAAVSSFGIGGTNAHVVLEEAPAINEPVGEDQPPRKYLLTLSARSEAALQQARKELAAFLVENSGVQLKDVEFTLRAGRREFPYRCAELCSDVDEAIRALSDANGNSSSVQPVKVENRPVVFMFPGQGAQHVNMGQALYEQRIEFRQVVDKCCELLKKPLGFDLRDVLFPKSQLAEQEAKQLTQTSITQPALFVIEYALARLWMDLGVRPAAMIGHSIGEYVAACLAGVFSLEDALALVAARGRMMQDLPPGTMLAVRLSEKELSPLLTEELSIAAVNGVGSCVVSGSEKAIAAFSAQLEGQKVACTRLHTSHAFHSGMMEPILAPFTQIVSNTKRNAPKIPYVSNVTGTWITEAEAMDPAYWARHLRQTVRCADDLGELFKDESRIFLEVGPGQTLTGLARQHPGRNSTAHVIPSQYRANEQGDSFEAIQRAAGSLWVCGASVCWERLDAGRGGRRTPLPTYPFERKRFWVEPVRATANSKAKPISETARERANDTPQSDISRTDSTVSALAMRNGQVVRKLKEIFGQLSGRDLGDVGERTTFIEMGFDSLFLTQASIALEKKLNVRVAFRELLDKLSSFEALGKHVESVLPQGTASDAGGIAGTSKIEESNPSRSEAEKAGDRQGIPLTEAQKEIWFASQMSDGASCAFNETRLVTFRGQLQESALRAALQGLVDRHESLRTTFSRDGETQNVSSRVSLELHLRDFSGLEVAARDSELGAIQRVESDTPFDLSIGPLLRTQLVRMAAGEHVLVMTVHHSVCDGRSWDILLQDLAAGYSAKVRAEEAKSAEGLQWSEFAREHSRASVERSASEAYWVNKFSENAPVLELPGDRPRPASWSFEGGRQTRAISKGLTERLKKWSAQRDCTLFTVLLTGYYALLNRLARQEALVVGIPIADRTMKGSDRLVGHCINFLPVLANIREGVSFSGLLQEVRRNLLEAYRHQHCTLGRLLQLLGVPREKSRMPLVSVTFNLETLKEIPRFEGLTAEFRLCNQAKSSFDLSFNLTEIEGELHIDARYNAALFDPATIGRWIGHFETLLVSAMNQPDEWIEELAILDRDQIRQLTVEWNTTSAEYDRNLCVHQLFEAQVQRSPKATAVVFQRQALSYEELNEKAKALAQHLIELGVGADVPVGICLERSLDLAVTVLGVWKAGGSCLPLDPDYPKARLEFMVADAKAPVLITQRDVKSRVNLVCNQTEVLCVDELVGKPLKSSGKLPATRAEHLAYVIYTSGSSGTPKGVAMPHRPLVNLVTWQARNSAAGQASKTLQLASLSFDVSFQEMLATWAAGGTLILVPEKTRRDPAGLLDLIASEQVNRLFLPYVALQQLAEAGIERRVFPQALREIITAGEQLRATPAIVEFFRELEGCALVNQYGPSETHVVSAFTLSGSPDTWPALPPIGKPVANAHLYLLDEHQQLVPVGVPGEIFIGGECLARGYLHRDSLTTERFPELGIEGGKPVRLYRTGDLGRRLPDGNIEFLRRADEQIKVRGYRVEPGEIEAALGKHPEVRESVASIREGRLLAHVVRKGESNGIQSSELRRYLGEKLPEYMVPAQVIFVESLPLTPSGKVDRRALGSLAGAERPEKPAIEAPRNATEETMAGIWREVLRVGEVGVVDNFFELGGHSLLMTQVLSRVRGAFGVEVPIRRFFEEPTVAALATAVMKEQKGGVDPSAIRPRTHPSRAAELLGRLDQLSDSEVEALLKEEDFKEVWS